MAALARQADLSVFDVIILANNCFDGTADIARAAGLRYPRLVLHVVEAHLPSDRSHAGGARKMVMDLAAERFLAVGNMSAIVATTDADTVLAPDWTVQMIQEMQTADAVAGIVDLREDEFNQLPAAVQALYRKELAFRRVWTTFESLVDPRLEDPEPRHGAFVSANLAVSVAVYRAAGGMPPLATLEDRHFLFALRRIDARIRFSLAARAWTSARRESRVIGGFGSFIDYLHHTAANQSQQLVRNPYLIINELTGRAALRTIWQGDASDIAVEAASRIFGIESTALSTLVDRSLPFGAVHEKVQFLASTDRTYEDIPVDDAVTILARACASRKAASPIRNTTASGAG